MPANIFEQFKDITNATTAKLSIIPKRLHLKVIPVTILLKLRLFEAVSNGAICKQTDHTEKYSNSLEDP